MHSFLGNQFIVTEDTPCWNKNLSVSPPLLSPPLLYSCSLIIFLLRLSYSHLIVEQCFFIFLTSLQTGQLELDLNELAKPCADPDHCGNPKKDPGLNGKTMNIFAQKNTKGWWACYKPGAPEVQVSWMTLFPAFAILVECVWEGKNGIFHCVPTWKYQIHT